ncbi:MAG: ADP-ribosylglycohydrolase family protein [Opitutales bacterium]
MSDKPSRTERLTGMIWGQFIGDAAGMGCHWIYNLTELDKAFPGGVQGFDQPPEGHYHANKAPGGFTHYGDAALILLESVAEQNGFDPVAFGQAFASGMDSKAGYAGYLDSATRGTLENIKTWREANPDQACDYQLGADDDQMAGVTSLTPVVAAHADDPDLEAVIERAVRVRQNNDRAVAYTRAHTRILKELLAGRDVHSALHRVEETVPDLGDFGLEIRRKIGEAFSLKLKDATEATGELGQACPLLSSFPAALHAFIRHHEDGFEAAVLATLRAGGDNAGRAAMIGAWLGAHNGVDALPSAWIDQVSAKDRIQQAVTRIVGG